MRLEGAARAVYLRRRRLPSRTATGGDKLGVIDVVGFRYPVFGHRLWFNRRRYENGEGRIEHLGETDLGLSEGRWDGCDKGPVGVGGAGELAAAHGWSPGGLRR